MYIEFLLDIMRESETNMYGLDPGLSVSSCERDCPMIDYAFPSLRPLSLP
jgi:hypothetical protein